MKEYSEFAHYLASESAKIIRQYFRASYSVDLKSDQSPVTIADKKAEEIMRELIMKNFPDHGVLGEEFGTHNPDAEYIWVLDPIDGTLNFISGGLMFGTLISLVKNGEPLFGIIHQPILGEMLFGSDSKTTLNGKQVNVRPCSDLSNAILLTSDPLLVDAHQDKIAFESLRKRVKIFRPWGDCYGYFLLATGCVDIMVDPIMNPWDIMAIIPIIRAAGGSITDYQGGNPVDGNSLIATAGGIHSEVVKLLNHI